MTDQNISLVTAPQPDYELLDSGAGEKLERFGSIVLSRPDPQALWHKRLPEKEWNKAAASFLRASEKQDGKPDRKPERKAGWQAAKSIPERWQISLGGSRFWIKPTAFKHVGVFPEQLENWAWIEKTIKKSPKKAAVLNLFGYTGGATLAAARAGAEVCHIDGSKTVITQARENAELSGLADAPIRWIEDDAIAFVKREIKRGRHYDGIIMDPPVFGHGPSGELWKIEEHFIALLDIVKQVLSPEPLFILVNGYASGYSAVGYENCLAGIVKGKGGTLASGELFISESVSSRLLPAGIFARWQS
jgi:23S rRNA (cytosine1962-C5)-methyltransferase